MTSDELRSEYHREDFGPIVRGKYAERLKEFSNKIDQLTSDYGDYTVERDDLFRDMTLDDMIAGIKQRRQQAETQPRQDGR